MGKYIIILIVLAVLLDVCLSGPRWSRGRGRGRGRDREERRRMRNGRRGGGWGMGDHGMFRGFEGFHGGRFNFGLGPRRDPWFGMDFSWGGEPRDEPWWKGPNVCFSMTEGVVNDTDEIRTHFSYESVICDGSDSTFKCTKTETTPRGQETTVELYECCPGFTRAQDDFGCMQEVPLYDIPTLLESLNLGELIKVLESSGLTSEILSSNTNNFTIFAPTDEAVKLFLPLVSEMEPSINLTDLGYVVMVSERIKDSVVDNTRNLLLGHVAVGSLTSSHISDNQIIETASPLKSTIRMNVYQRPVELLTANCKKVTKADNLASNGVVHVLDDVLKPVSETLLDLVQKNPELSTLKTALGSSALAASLREDGQFTLFAPTDTAFKNHKDLLLKIMTNPDCMENVLKNHLLPNVICSAIIQGETRTSNVLKKRTNLSRDADDKLYVDGAQIVTSDIMATNGVLYIIDDVLIPEEALNMLQLAEKKDLVEFGKLVDLAGLKKELRHTENVTIFVPSNEAIKALPASVVANLGKDQQALQELLQYHIVPDVLSCSKFYNNLQLDTLQGTQLRINEYSSFPFGRHWTQTVQCANIDSSSIKGCNGAVYVIDKVLLPPSGNVLDVLAQNKKFSTLTELVKIAGIADVLQEDGPYTMFAPTDEAFKALGSDAVEELKQNPETLKSVLLNHVTRDTICCAGVIRANWFDSQKVRTLSGEVFRIGKTRGGETYIDNSDVIQCDLTATNGVVHVIDDVITTPRRRRPWEWIWEFK
ncbi:transforming growth factor-beta-induced protein ig-h3-like [Mercenaria mercenaria]|uniref:transforming growth factor-beta-induced protein ig-h3-like n=1 Tax=Mercenaria mercenaria TaxID=6596 RepID=UPI001E1DDE5F|nr:transforming growth factor-beta-induced protein ig-h3-like [Mercenaria mercenaria]